MLEKPEIRDQEIIAHLEGEYGLRKVTLTFLALGADQNTAVYRAEVSGGRDYFLKLRFGDFNEASVRVPDYLHSHGLREVISALPNRSGRLLVDAGSYRLVVYPYIIGVNAFERALSKGQWAAFGAALRRLHDTVFPEQVTNEVPREGFTPRWCDALANYMGLIQHETFMDPEAAELADFLNEKRAETLELMEQVERLRRGLHAQPPPYRLCHADIHGWNLLIADSGALYMVDWDTVIFAPKERDLMFIGGGLAGSGHTPHEEETLFYAGYGAVNLNHTALTYYRCVRIIEDLAVYSQQIFDSTTGGEDRRAAMLAVKSNYGSGGTIELALRARL